MIKVNSKFVPTHQTAGLPGYPAEDLFGAPNEKVVAGDGLEGTVRRHSGKPCSEGGTPGGAYGRSIYIAATNGDDHYLTHLRDVYVKVGDNVRPGTVLASLCDSAVSHKPGTTHVHHGCHRAEKPPRPPVRHYDVRGPKGRRHVKAGPISEVAKKLPGLVKRFGPMTVSDADSRE